MLKKNISYHVAIIFIFIIPCSNQIILAPILTTSKQMIVVLTDSATAIRGNLFCFERHNSRGKWESFISKIPVVIGHSGLGWGRGLHHITSNSDLPLKREGDGRSPAGIFRLSSVFGYLPLDHVGAIKMPYIHITELSECIDDDSSAYYNLIVSREDVEEIDWRTSEKMRSAGIYYEWGVIVDHNRDPIEPGAGSCIFLHNWSNPDETTAGCTAMAPESMKEIVYWLSEENDPLLIQLTRELYDSYRNDLKLPDIIW